MASKKGGLTRRRFCWLAANAVPAGAVLAACSCTDDSRQIERKIKLCPLAQLKIGRNIFALENLLLVRERNSLGAMALTCTHQRCTLRIDSDTNVVAPISCPCHGSLFSERGDVLKGPATEPIPWYEVSLDEHEMIVINLSKRMSPDWRFKI